MKTTWILGGLLLILAAPGAVAALDTYETQTASVGGIISSGTIRLNVAQPQDHAGRIGDVWHSNAFLSGPSATTPTVTWTALHQHGCEIGTPTTVTTVLTGGDFTSSFDVDMTLTDTTCSSVVRVQVFAGVLSTKIYENVFAVTIPAEGETLGEVVLASMPFLLAFALISLGEYRGDFGLRGLGGVIMIVGAFTLPLNVPETIEWFLRVACFFFAFYEILLYAFAPEEAKGKIRTR